MPCGGSHLIKFVNVGGLSSGACATAGNSDGTSAYPRVPRNSGASRENSVSKIDDGTHELHTIR